MKYLKLNWLAFLAVMATAAAAFVLDLHEKHSSLVIINWMGYFLPLVLTVFVSWRFSPFVAAAVLSGLMLAGYYAEVRGNIAALPTRLLGISSLWLMALVIFQRRRALSALRESEMRFRSLFENMPEGFAHCRMIYEDGKPADFIYLAVNRHFETITGLKDVVGRKVTEVIPGIREAHPELFEIYGRVSSGGQPERFEVHLETLQVWVEVSVYSPAKWYFVAIFDDITKRKRTEEELRKLSRAVEHSPASIVITNRAGNIEYVNPKFCEVTGYLAEEVVGKNPRILKSGEMPSEGYRQLWETITSGKEWRGEFHNRKKNGELYWELAAISPISSADGKITHFLAVKEDITERKRAEKELQMFQFGTDHAADAVFWMDRDGGFYYVNDQACRSLGYTREELMRLRLFDIDPVYTKAHWDENWERFQRKEIDTQRLESIQRRKDGSTFPIEVTAKHFSMGGVDLHVAFVRDITERKRADEKIKEQAALLDKAQDAIFVTDMEGRVVYWNKGAERTFGWTASEAIGKDSIDLNFHGVATQQVLEAARITKEHGEWVGELAEITKDGRNITVQGRTNLIRDEQGRPKGLLIIDTDITEKKRLEEQFLRGQRMDSLGALAGGIAHDLNNVLTPLLMSVLMLKEKITDADGQSLLDALETNVRRGASLVKQVLIFGRGIKGERVPVQPVRIAREIEQIIRETFPKSVEFKLLSAPDLWTVTGDPTQLHQVMLNLCLNARDAMPEGGKLSVLLENAVLEKAFTWMNLGTKPGPYVVITVADNGSGIPREIQNRIFEPFFTTKKIGDGTGLGLSTSLGIVKSHGGFINCYSEEDNGSTFKVYLPASTAPEAAEIAAPEPRNLPRGHDELVLVVDDEEPIRNVAKKMLERFGYRVLTAANGSEAVTLYESRQKEVAAVITDMAMPVMDGPTTIIALKSINSKVKIIGSSGMTSDGSVSAAMDAGVKHFISKPYTVELFLQTLREVIGEQP